MKCTKTEENGINILQIVGFVGIAETQELRKIIMDDIENNNKTKYILEVSKVPLLSSSGLGLFLSIHKILDQKGGFLKIKNPSKGISRLLKTTHIASIIEIIS